jgi:hypothetical protein
MVEDVGAKLSALTAQAGAASGGGWLSGPINKGAGGFTAQGKMLNLDRKICGGKPKSQGFFAKMLADMGFNSNDFASGFTQAAQGCQVQSSSFQDIGHGLGSPISSPDIGPSIHKLASDGRGA